VEHGFIQLTREEEWQQGKEREWRVTILPCNGHEPTHDWQQWQPGQPVRKAPEGVRMTPGVPTQKNPGYPIGPVLGIRLGQYWVSDWATPLVNRQRLNTKNQSVMDERPRPGGQNSAPI